MGGTPMRVATASWLESLGDAACERLIFDRIADGTSMRRLLRLLQMEADLDDPPLTLTMLGLYKWKKAKPERIVAWDEALKAQATNHAEDAGEILDDAEMENVFDHQYVRKAEARAKHRVWLASVNDRERYGEARQSAAIQINVGTLQLTAMKDVGAVMDGLYEEVAITPDVKRLPPESADFEVVLGDLSAPDPLDDVFGPPSTPSLDDVLG